MGRRSARGLEEVGVAVCPESTVGRGGAPGSTKEEEVGAPVRQVGGRKKEKLWSSPARGVFLERLWLANTPGRLPVTLGRRISIVSVLDEKLIWELQLEAIFLCRRPYILFGGLLGTLSGDAL